MVALPTPRSGGRSVHPISVLELTKFTFRTAAAPPPPPGLPATTLDATAVTVVACPALAYKVCTAGTTALSQLFCSQMDKEPCICCPRVACATPTFTQLTCDAPHVKICCGVLFTVGPAFCVGVQTLDQAEAGGTAKCTICFP